MSSPNIPVLEERFTEPEGWRWHSFKRKGVLGERTIRFGSAFPKDKVPHAVIVCLPGLSEFGEKYFEVARTCLEMNFAFWVIDWAGQGAGSRYLNNPHKRHSTSFKDDVEDLQALILGYVKHSSVHPDVGRIPMAMLAHSMGGNIGLRYLEKYPETFECAAFCAPMLGLRAVNDIPFGLARPLSALLNFFAGQRYVWGGGNYDPAIRMNEGARLLSHDPVRNAVQGAWFDAQPALQVGAVTNRWLYYAMRSCRYLRKTRVLKGIQPPCIMALAREDHLVDNARIRAAAEILPRCKLLEFDSARHEILMEKDAVRDVFFKAFYALVKEHIMDRPETLKPF